MDTKSLIAETKARFSQNSARAYLKDKYDSKLIIADQGGLWKADQATISFLSSPIHEGWNRKQLVCMDTFGNPVKVDADKLLEKLRTVYEGVMTEWHKEWSELENKR